MSREEWNPETIGLYKKGFNFGYSMAENDPIMLRNLIDQIKGGFHYTLGMRDGAAHYDHEQIKEEHREKPNENNKGYDLNR